MNTYTDNTSSSYTTSSPSTLTAVFDDREEAGSAVQRLVEAGVDSANVRLVAGDESDPAIERTDDNKGFLSSPISPSPLSVETI